MTSARSTLLPDLLRGYLAAMIDARTWQEGSMKLREVLETIEGRVISKHADLDLEVEMGCGADLMSDVLDFTRDGTLLMSGLTNPQVVHTADAVGVKAIIFVRGKMPIEETIALAEEKNIPLLVSKYPMFEICGRLYEAGLPSCGLFESTLNHWRDTFAGGDRGNLS
jgi:hypothetical protein